MVAMLSRQIFLIRVQMSSASSERSASSHSTVRPPDVRLVAPTSVQSIPLHHVIVTSLCSVRKRATTLVTTRRVVWCAGRTGRSTTTNVNCAKLPALNSKTSASSFVVAVVSCSCHVCVITKLMFLFFIKNSRNVSTSY